MESNFITEIVKDLPAKTLRIKRTFDASLDDVWNAWTEREMLDRWWAPKPWMTETKSLNFSERGGWHYVVRGCSDEEHWSVVEFKNIKPLKSFEAVSWFCDEEGIKKLDEPVMHWKNFFKSAGDTTHVEIEILFSRESDVDIIVERGFRKGLTAAFENLDDVLNH